MAERNRLAIYKGSRGSELGTTEYKSSKWPERDSNPGPPDCESDALTTWPRCLLAQQKWYAFGVYRGFNKFLHKWVLKSNRRVHLPKAQRGFDPGGVRGHASPENFEVLDSRRCIFKHFQVYFFAPKSTKNEAQYQHLNDINTEGFPFNIFN